MKNEEYLYEQNIKNMKKFFKTDLYKKLITDKNISEIDKINKIKNIINCWWFKIKNEKVENFYVRKSIWEKEGLDESYKAAKEHIEILKAREKIPEEALKIYEDPDSNDEKLYNYINKNYNYEVKKNQSNQLYFNDKKINFSLDGIIGWKAIINALFLKNKKIKDIENVTSIYEIIRNPKNAGHLIWPTHAIPTINTERYQKFRDRIDYTLYDIKRFYDTIKKEISELKLAEAYVSNSYRWLTTFKNFDDFINQMHLNRWCIEDKNGNYQVIDLSQNIDNIKNKKNNPKMVQTIDSYFHTVKISPEEYNESKKIWGSYSIYNNAITYGYLQNVIYIISNSDNE